MNESLAKNIGATVAADGLTFRIPAPNRRKVTVVSADGSAPDLQLTKDAHGYFTGTCTQRRAGDLYKIKLDDESDAWPDPASRFQPQGPHGPSQIVDSGAYPWKTENWKGIEPVDIVLYEMHIGTFTPEGSWQAAIQKLPDLKDVGITCLEIMPVAACRGKWNWGYDGVDLYAPIANYGTPDDMRDFIDAAHGLGLGVILDVVYNHLGPDGNYLPKFIDTIFSKKHGTDWGEAINYDGEASQTVRDFYIANAVYWISDFRLDGFRFDATQNIYDDSKPHILAQITDAARKAAGERRLYIVAENEPQDANVARPTNVGGLGFDALWNDDWHHSAMVALSGRNEAYYADYEGRPQEFLSASKWGYLFQGQNCTWQKKRRGTNGFDLAPHAFVNYLQNHDQIANYGRGHRVTRMAASPLLRAITVLTLLAPQTPLLFQGQEWMASTDFNFFTDHGPELGKLIRAGRIKELSQFDSIKDPAMIATLPDPSARETFEQSKLNWNERSYVVHREALLLHKELLRIRREDPVLRAAQRSRHVDGAVLSENAFVLRYFGQKNDDRLLVVNLGSDLHKTLTPEPLLAPSPDKRWTPIISSEEPRFGGHGVIIPESRGEPWRLPTDNWRISGLSAMLLTLEPEPKN